MKARAPKYLAMALLGVFLTTACGGGSMNAGGGVDGSGFVSQGSVTATGSIIVNGAEFDTRNAIVIVRGAVIGVGDDVVRDQIDIGKIVIVEGRRITNPDTLVADRVIYSSTVQGPVERILDIDASTKEIVVLGQNVIVNLITLLKDTTFDGIARNDMIEVSGFIDNTGTIWAAFIAKTGVFNPGMEAEVKGFVRNLDPKTKTFQVNNLLVDYALADTSRLPGGRPANGQLVEVEGTLEAASAEISATEIRPGDELGAVNADEIEITGFVTDFVSVSEFTLGNQTVRAEAGTLYVDGTPDQVAPGVKLEVSGKLVDGVLLATEIEFWAPNQIEVEDLVTEIVSISEFTVGNQVVQTDATTVFEGGRPEDIALDVKLEVKGVPIDNDRSILIADKVSFEVE